MEGITWEKPSDAENVQEVRIYRSLSFRRHQRLCKENGHFDRPNFRKIDRPPRKKADRPVFLKRTGNGKADRPVFPKTKSGPSAFAKFGRSAFRNRPLSPVLPGLILNRPLVPVLTGLSLRGLVPPPKHLFLVSFRLFWLPLGNWNSLEHVYIQNLIKSSRIQFLSTKYISKKEYKLS